jgi:hypothetical protein
MQAEAPETLTDEMFARIEAHKKELPIMLIGFSVLLSLFSAGLIEAHVTGRIMALLS